MGFATACTSSPDVPGRPYIELTSATEVRKLSDSISRRLPQPDFGPNRFSWQANLEPTWNDTSDHTFLREEFSTSGGRGLAYFNYFIQEGDYWITHFTCLESRQEYAPDYMSPLMIECLELPAVDLTAGVIEQLKASSSRVSIDHGDIIWERVRTDDSLLFSASLRS